MTNNHNTEQALPVANQNPRQKMAEKLRSIAKNKRAEIATYVGKSKVDKFIADLILMTVSSSLMNCKPSSIFEAALKVSQVGLSIVPQEKEAYIVPYDKEAQLQIGYIGYQKLALQAGIVIDSELVYKQDHLDVTADANGRKIDFKMNIFEREDHDPHWIEENLNGAIVWVNYVHLDVTKQEFVSAKTLRKLKGCSQSVIQDKYSPWKDWAAEMYKAKAIKYVASKLPKAGQNKLLAVAAAFESEQPIQQLPRSDVNPTFSAPHSGHNILSELMVPKDTSTVASDQQPVTRTGQTADFIPQNQESLV